MGVWRVTQGTQSRCSATAWRDGVGREVAGGSGGRGHMYAYGWFMLMYGENHNTVIILQLKKKNCYYPQLQFIPTQFDKVSPNPSQLPINQWKFLEAIQRKQGTKKCAVNFHWPHSAVESILGWASEDLGLPPVWPWASVKSDGQTDKLQLQSHQTMNGVLWFCVFEVHNRLSLIKYILLRKTFKSLIHSQNTTVF